ncbi:hypothetical protein PGT21_022573 [Puccinia graminis f. sp. tritici]|uniref:Uncharacterized protein n=1 Tax=Puccinia graminis f. sp. tritici TaxID=56615 RepID=A0A5B0QNA0_PUCGR|nr:hypothetical protein PGT21_022573 [Puccinia graminis f. sp. tritici]
MAGNGNDQLSGGLCTPSMEWSLGGVHTPPAHSIQWSSSKAHAPPNDRRKPATQRPAKAGHQMECMIGQKRTYLARWRDGAVDVVCGLP